MNIRRALASFVALGLVALVISGCTNDSALPVTAGHSASGTGAPLTVVAAGTALPDGYKFDSGRTMIFGTDERWTGRLSYTTTLSADDTFDFLHREMPNFGWTEVAAMRSTTSFLTFTSEATGRVATIEIEHGGWGGSTHVDMVVMPQDTHTSRASGYSSTAPAPLSRPVAH